MNAPIIKCPQCGSDGCGVYRCRFSGLTHKEYVDQQAAKLYAEDAIRRAKEEPSWLRELRQGPEDGIPGVWSGK